jgi:pantoate kinase
MSAAGALSSAMAAAKAWGLGRSVAVRAAHLAEIENRTGLGDVAGAITGGYELRTSAGLPPFGAPRRLLAFGELVLAVVGPPMATSSVLRDPARRAAVQAVGGKFVDELARAPSLENFFELSRRFASESGLLTAEVQRALDLVASVPESRASMSMLGNSIFAHGPSRKIEAVLRAAYPDVWRCSIDAEGARALSVASSPRMPDSTFRRPDGSRPNGRPDPAGD